MSTLQFTDLKISFNMLTMSKFGVYLTQACEEKGTTPYQVAIDVGLPQSTMSQIVNGKRKAKEDHLRKIATSTVLNVPYHRLIVWKAIDQFGPDILEGVQQYIKEEVIQEKTAWNGLSQE